MDGVDQLRWTGPTPEFAAMAERLHSARSDQKGSTTPNA